MLVSPSPLIPLSLPVARANGVSVGATVSMLKLICDADAVLPA